MQPSRPTPARERRRRRARGPRERQRSGVPPSVLILFLLVTDYCWFICMDTEFLVHSTLQHILPCSLCEIGREVAESPGRR